MTTTQPLLSRSSSVSSPLVTSASRAREPPSQGGSPPDGYCTPALGGGARWPTDASGPVRLALAKRVHRRHVPADRATDPDCRASCAVGQRVPRLRRHRPRCLRVPGDVAGWLAGGLALPSGLHRRIATGDPGLSVVPVARPSDRLGHGALALSPVAVGGRRGTADGHSSADQGTVPARR